MHTATDTDRHYPATRRIRRDHRSGIAYLLGRPSSVWQAALASRTTRHR